jgi:hypothetical protein
MTLMKRCLIAVVVFISGCGRFKPPLPPEMFAPKPPEALVVTPSSQGVGFSWVASDEDMQGKELKYSGGFNVERKTIAQRGDETNPDVRFEKIGFIQDKHVSVREELRKAARAEGKIGRTIEAPSSMMDFVYLDKTVVNGATYIYQIVPVNQRNVEGGIAEVIRVIFKGSESDVTRLSALDVPEDANQVGKTPGASGPVTVGATPAPKVN